MRFYLDDETARWFRRTFMRPMKQSKFPQSYVPLLTASWRDPHLDLTQTGRNSAFVRWLAKHLRRCSYSQGFRESFKALADKIEALSERSAIDRLADIVDPSRIKVDHQGPVHESPRACAVRARLRRRKIKP